MTFSSRIKPYFIEETRQRGKEYFQFNRVIDMASTRTSLRGLVKGSRTYHCGFEMESADKGRNISLQIDCDCPSFKHGYHCKHLWALALKVDGDEWADPVLNAKNVFLVESHEEDDDDYSDDDEEDESDLYDDEYEDEEEPAFIPWDEFKRSLAIVDGARLPGDIVPLPSVKGKERSLYYVLDLGSNLEGGDVPLRFYYREHLMSGRMSAFKPLSLGEELSGLYSDSKDRELYRILNKEGEGFKEGYSSSYYRTKSILLTTRREERQGILLPGTRALDFLILLAEAERLYYFPKEARTTVPALLKASPESWHLEARVRNHDDKRYQLEAVLVQGHTTREPREFEFFSNGRFAISQGVLYPTTLVERSHKTWFEQLVDSRPIVFPKADLDIFVSDYSRIPLAPAIQWPEDFAWAEEALMPRPRLRLSPYHILNKALLAGEIIFQYPDENVNSINLVPSWVDPQTKKIKLRDFSAEKEHVTALHALKNVQPLLEMDWRSEGKTIQVLPEDLSEIVEALEALGWDIDVEGQRVRVLKDFEIVAEGETDWFDLSIVAKMEAQAYHVPQLLRSKSKEGFFIPLGNSEWALLPDEWRRRFEIFEKSGEIVDERFRIPSHQALLLDSLLAELTFENRSPQLRAIREKIRTFKALEPIEAPAGFQGNLREYQKEGLAWLEFLQNFGFGGCLADEMGLGKTIQVLAMLLRFHSAKKRPPSLVVVPRSLVGNWLSEAEKFCPSLKVVDRSGSVRSWDLGVEPPDLIVITYGTLRQDILKLSKIEFGYIVLDESQAIKNHSSQVAKAALLLKGQHRLAMSGTPVENHLSELMSLMAFINPGLLDSPHWKELFKKKFDANNPHLKNLVVAIRPLMLRRTKAQVLKDLPPKIEDVLYCELEGEQKKHYEELRLHYQVNLLPRLQDETWRQSSIVVIEALLRLRQAACHSGLVDPRFIHVPSCKLENLMEKLEEIRESGHKALIFSQFTSFLKIVSDRFTSEAIPFEYLDGKTRDRAARVTRFQTDPNVPFFLISLKAGGVGLNLTAADYCFILDPWWNPAAEAQAIDRAHRINQQNTVFAYRLIAKGTVEEKIQELQSEKRLMMESILEGEGALLRELDLKSIQSLFN